MKCLPFSVLIIVENIEIRTMQLPVDKLPSLVGGVFLGEFGKMSQRKRKGGYYEYIK